MSSHCRAAMALAASTLLLAGCFDDPIRERLDLRFRPDGGMRIELTVELRPPIIARQDPLAVRLAEHERMLLEGWSPWHRRFEMIATGSEGGSWQRDRGQLIRYRQWADLEDPATVSDFFADTLVQAFYQEGEGWAEVGLYPTAGNRARPDERQRADTALGEWSEAIAEYLESVGALYSYLEDSPSRSRAAFGALFGVDESEAPGALDLDDGEEELVTAIDQRMDGVIALFELDDEGRSLEELSLLVFDPFPALTSVHLPGAPVESEGFEIGATDQLVVPRTSFWAALARLEGTWVAPDPLLVLVREMRREDEIPFGLEDFADRPRFRADSLPTADEVREALLEGLRPAPAYRAVWARDLAKE